MIDVLKLRVLQQCCDLLHTTAARIVLMREARTYGQHDSKQIDTAPDTAGSMYHTAMTHRFVATPCSEGDMIASTALPLFVCSTNEPPILHKQALSAGILTPPSFAGLNFDFCCGFMNMFTNGRRNHTRRPLHIVSSWSCENVTEVLLSIHQPFSECAGVQLPETQRPLRAPPGGRE